MKSKGDVLDETIDDYDPSSICIVEALLVKEEQIEIPGIGYIE